MARIPVLVLTGFLGAGKTTMLNALLKVPDGPRVGVIVNELGAIDVDTAIISSSGGSSGDTVQLPNGCCCCTVKDELRDSIVQLLDAARAPIDWLVIETTGVADPAPIAQTLMHEELCERVHLGAVVTLLAADTMETVLAEYASAQLQIDTADVVVVTKADLVEAAVITEIKEWLKECCGKATVLSSARDQMPLTQLLVSQKRGEPSAAAAAAAVAPSSHLAVDGFVNAAVTSEEPFSWAAFCNTWLSLPPEVIRAKGFARFQGHAACRYLLHRVGKRSTIEVLPEDEHEHKHEHDDHCHHEADNVLVFIGPKFDPDPIRARVLQCTAPAKAAATNWTEELASLLEDDHRFKPLQACSLPGFVGLSFSGVVGIGMVLPDTEVSVMNRQLADAINQAGQYLVLPCQAASGKGWLVAVFVHNDTSCEAFWDHLTPLAVRVLTNAFFKTICC